MPATSLSEDTGISAKICIEGGVVGVERLLAEVIPGATEVQPAVEAVCSLLEQSVRNEVSKPGRKCYSFID